MLPASAALGYASILPGAPIFHLNLLIYVVVVGNKLATRGTGQLMGIACPSFRNNKVQIISVRRKFFLTLLVALFASLVLKFNLTADFN
ncbi:hypothetical protein DMW38_15035 [Vibrio parahaemolyticus]|nr:hypothetical protein [Vibrio parahaemolyticus]